MKSPRTVYITTLAVILTALYLLMPACGSKGNNNSPVATYPYGPGTVCVPGQQCTGYPGGQYPPGAYPQGGGLPLLQAPAVSRLDYAGSTATMNFLGTNVIAGRVYSGPVNIAGTVVYVGGGYCPPGQYTIQAQGQWYGGYGGQPGKVVAQGQIMGGPMGGMMVSLNGMVYAGQDMFSQTPTTYYYWGDFRTSCDPSGVAN